MSLTAELVTALRSEIRSAPGAELPSIFGEFAGLGVELLARLFAQQQISPIATHAEDDEADRLLTVAQAAQKLGQRDQWVRAHQDELHSRVQLPGRTIRFSERKLDAWLKRRTA